MRIDKGHRKNHYVPEGYLKHFTNPEGKIFAFDKKAKYKSNEILEKTPSQICFEYNRYLMTFPKGEEVTDLEKDTYGYYDNKHASAFRVLNESDIDADIWSMEVVGSLEEFIPLQYWRSPASDLDFQEKLAKARRIDEFGITVHESAGAKPSTDPELHRMILRERNSPQGLRPPMALSTFGKDHPIYDTLEWRILEFQSDSPTLTSDNPTIFKEPPKEPEDFRGTAVLPLGNSRTLIRIRENLDTEGHDKFWQDMVQIQQSHQYVLSADKEYLKFCLEEYRKHDFNSKIESLRNQVFKNY